jgi:hypothetical protein
MGEYLITFSMGSPMGRYSCCAFPKPFIYYGLTFLLLSCSTYAILSSWKGLWFGLGLGVVHLTYISGLWGLKLCCVHHIGLLW